MIVKRHDIKFKPYQLLLKLAWRMCCRLVSVSAQNELQIGLLHAERAAGRFR